MADQTTILTLLCDAREPAPMDALAYAVWRKNRAQPKEAVRKQTLECIGRLLQKKLARRTNDRVLPAAIGGRKDTKWVPLYEATPAGRKLIASGKSIVSGPNGNLTGLFRKPKADAFRQRLWNALRVQRKGTLPELIELARRDEDSVKAHDNARKYMAALVRAGVAVRLQAREKGYALSSPGFVRFALITDLGPLAPIAATKHLVDQNARQPIAYRKHFTAADRGEEYGQHQQKGKRHG